jgi:hypothetical protein
LQRLICPTLGFLVCTNIQTAEEDYQKTPASLIQITERCVGQHPAPEAAAITPSLRSKGINIEQAVARDVYHSFMFMFLSCRVLERACIKRNIQEPQDVELYICASQ